MPTSAQQPTPRKFDAPALLFPAGGDVVNRRDTLRRRGLALADILALVLAAAVVAVIAPLHRTSPNELLLLIMLPLAVVLNKSLRLYDRDANLIHKSTLNELPSILQSVSLTAALAYLFMPELSGVPIDRTQLLIFWAAACVLTPALRYGTRQMVRRQTEAERVLIVGSGLVATLVSRKLSMHPEYGADIVGFVDLPREEVDPAPDNGLPHLGDASDFEAVCQTHGIERILVAYSSLEEERLLDVIRLSKRLRLKVSIVPRLYEVIGRSVEIDQIEGMTLLGLRGLGRTSSTLKLKRGVDIIGSVTGLLILLPALTLIALLIRLTSQGPVLYRQCRVGRRNREFNMFKFRTMITGADEMKDELRHRNEMNGGPMFKIADDPRVTRVGRWLRAMSLDEFPQLWNVLRGEMSLVGPRPLVPEENDHVMGWHRARLDLTPGLTGPWQVMGRNAIPFDEMVKLDYLYVAEWSLWNDIKLMIRTLPVVAGRRGS